MAIFEIRINCFTKIGVKKKCIIDVANPHKLFAIHAVYICSNKLMQASARTPYVRPVAAYRAGTAMALSHLWGTRTSEYAKVVVITTQYGHITFKLLATVRYM